MADPRKAGEEAGRSDPLESFLFSYQNGNKVASLLKSKKRLLKIYVCILSIIKKKNQVN